jgi:hypothetical protein
MMWGGMKRNIKKKKMVMVKKARELVYASPKPDQLGNGKRNSLCPSLGFWNSSQVRLDLTYLPPSEASKIRDSLKELYVDGKR